jgi:hypothetical protein
MMPHPIPIELVREIRHAYLEEPDLRLRPHVAQRRWRATAPVCRAAFRVLADTGFLLRSTDGTYGRSAVSASASREAPWDCRWAEPMPGFSSRWLGARRMRWTCLRDGGPTELSAEDCVACPRWEPLLVDPTR